MLILYLKYFIIKKFKDFKNYISSLFSFTGESIYLICKVDNQELFDSYFHGKFQPGWEYFPQKKVLKIELNSDLISFLRKREIGFGKFLEFVENDEKIITLDIPLLKTFGELSIYVNYLTDKKKLFTNVYSRKSIFEISDFHGIPNHTILCCSVRIPNIKNKYIYITTYIKQFSSKYKLTPEILLNNYPIDADLKETVLSILTINSIKFYKYDETI